MNCVLRTVLLCAGIAFGVGESNLSAQAQSGCCCRPAYDSGLFGCETTCAPGISNCSIEGDYGTPIDGKCYIYRPDSSCNYGGTTYVDLHKWHCTLISCTLPDEESGTRCISEQDGSGTTPSVHPSTTCTGSPCFGGAVSDC